jgi:hypothetical protein
MPLAEFEPKISAFRQPTPMPQIARPVRPALALPLGQFCHLLCVVSLIVIFQILCHKIATTNSNGYIFKIYLYTVQNRVLLPTIQFGHLLHTDSLHVFRKHYTLIKAVESLFYCKDIKLPPSIMQYN